MVTTFLVTPVIAFAIRQMMVRVVIFTLGIAILLTSTTIMKTSEPRAEPKAAPLEPTVEP
jgi:hypothetical protein